MKFCRWWWYIFCWHLKEYIQSISTIIAIIGISDHLICLLIWIHLLDLFSYITYLLGPPFSRLCLTTMLLRRLSQYHFHVLTHLSLILIEISILVVKETLFFVIDIDFIEA